MSQVLLISDSIENTRFDVARKTSTFKSYDLEPVLAIPMLDTADGTSTKTDIGEILDYCFEECKPACIALSIIRDPAAVKLVADKLASCEHNAVLSEISLISREGEVLVTSDTYEMVMKYLLPQIQFLSINIYEAEKHGSLKHLASVYNPDNDTFSPGLDEYGPRIVNFADILQYNYFPLAEAISKILAEVKDAFGSPVEIEYAVNLNKAKNGKPTFYLLQIKPMVGSFDTTDIDLSQVAASPDTLLYTNQSLGNGVIDTITDVIYIDESKFDKLATVEMEREINYLNSLLGNENRKYILIGPGRWGTSDRFLGVPVQWSEINNAAVIIETSLDGYPLDFSNGSHFFHNITSMNVGYFAVRKENRNSFLRREILEAQELIQSTQYFRHVRFAAPLKVIMNGSKNEAGITTIN